MKGGDIIMDNEKKKTATYSNLSIDVKCTCGREFKLEQLSLPNMMQTGICPGCGLYHTYGFRISEKPCCFDGYQ